MKQQMFDVFNLTDGIMASRDSMNETDADIFIATFPTRFYHQGYYRNNRGQKMDPRDVKLRKIRVDAPEDFAQAMRDSEYLDES